MRITVLIRAARTNTAGPELLTMQCLNKHVDTLVVVFITSSNKEIYRIVQIEVIMPNKWRQ
jgi:hypothetical protein